MHLTGLFFVITYLNSNTAIQSKSLFTILKIAEEQVQNVGPCKVVLFEGIFALYDQEIRDMLDIKCFLHVDSDIRFTRRLHRDVKERGRSLESVISQYYDTVRPMYQKYLDPQRQFADFTVGEETDVASLILSARIKELIDTAQVTEIESHKAV